MSEGLAVMLSVVVFGLGAAAVVAQNELRDAAGAPAFEMARIGTQTTTSAIASVPSDGTRHVHTSSSPVTPPRWSPVGDVAR